MFFPSFAHLNKDTVVSREALSLLFEALLTFDSEERRQFKPEYNAMPSVLLEISRSFDNENIRIDVNRTTINLFLRLIRDTLEFIKANKPVYCNKVEEIVDGVLVTTLTQWRDFVHHTFHYLETEEMCLITGVSPTPRENKIVVLRSSYSHGNEPFISEPRSRSPYVKSSRSPYSKGNNGY
jgi:hypothetical protein